MAEALFLVERGWHALRECSLDAGRRGIAVTYLIKGSLSPGVRAMIRLIPLMRAVDVPRSWFYVAVWWRLLAGALGGRVRWVVTDDERTPDRLAGWCRRFRVSLVRVEETSRGYTLSVRRQAVPFEQVFGAAT